MNIPIEYIEKVVLYVLGAGAVYGALRYKIQAMYSQLFDSNGTPVLPVLTQRVLDHHKMLHDDQGFPRFFTKVECKENHAEVWTQFSFRLNGISNQIEQFKVELGKIAGLQTDIHKLQLTIATLLERMQRQDGLRAYDPRTSEEI
jgi:hypothetical protein